MRLLFRLLKGDMPFVSGYYMIEDIEVNDYIEKYGLFFSKKLRKMGPTISTGRK